MHAVISGISSNMAPGCIWLLQETFCKNVFVINFFSLIAIGIFLVEVSINFLPPCVFSLIEALTPLFQISQLSYHKLLNDQGNDQGHEED